MTDSILEITVNLDSITSLQDIPRPYYGRTWPDTEEGVYEAKLFMGAAETYEERGGFSLVKFNGQIYVCWQIGN